LDFAFGENGVLVGKVEEKKKKFGLLQKDCYMLGKEKKIVGGQVHRWRQERSAVNNQI
jgi:hypothetical protein